MRQEHWRRSIQDRRGCSASKQEFKPDGVPIGTHYQKVEMTLFKPIDEDARGRPGPTEVDVTLYRDLMTSEMIHERTQPAALGREIDRRYLHRSFGMPQ